MLPSLLRTIPKQPPLQQEPEDIFQSSLSTIFTDDLVNSHGDPGTIVTYRSVYGDLEFEVADPVGEEERSKFAHYVWNAGILMGELVGGRIEGIRCEGNKEEKEKLEKEDQWGVRCFGDEGTWWLSRAEEEAWSVKGESVLELGAGVGLAGIMCALAGAEAVTISDYPAPTIIETLKANVVKNVPESIRARVTISAHIWGDLESSFAVNKRGQYTRIIAADTLWLYSQHHNLARSMLHFLSPDPKSRVFVIAGFHTGRAKLAHFFENAIAEIGLTIEEIFEMDADGKRREWKSSVAEESIGERKRWLVVARLMRIVCD